MTHIVAVVEPLQQLYYLVT